MTLHMDGARCTYVRTCDHLINLVRSIALTTVTSIMADGTEELSVVVEKFRLINEPKNHWEARKKFLLNNWDDYPEMQLVSLSMVWANMQFDGCK